VGRSEGNRHFEDLNVDVRIISKCIFKKWDGVHRIEPDHDRDRWRDLVNAVMNLRFP
jgi:hypothetical protein